MEKVIHRAEDRGHANHGWLEARHSFSFANWYDPNKIHFGALRVLNDDIVQPGKGFPTHPHDNMEIITIPLKGALEHKDSMGAHGVIRSGEVQVMSAGTGVEHSEFNHSDSQIVNLLQIWIFPREKGVRPRHDQRRYNNEDLKNKFVTVVNPDHEEGMYIHQDAWLSIGDFDEGSFSYRTKDKDTGIYFFVIDGSVMANGETLIKRDALGITSVENVDFEIMGSAKVLAIEVPLKW